MSSENLESESRDEKRFKETLNSPLYTDTTSSDHPSHMLRSLHFAPYVYATHSQVEEHSLCTCISTKFPFHFPVSRLQASWSCGGKFVLFPT
jgi:hypothetical protein